MILSAGVAQSIDANTIEIGGGWLYSSEPIWSMDYTEVLVQPVSVSAVGLSDLHFLGTTTTIVVRAEPDETSEVLWSGVVHLVDDPSGGATPPTPTWTYHNLLLGRSVPDTHPIESITGLSTALADLGTSISVVSNDLAALETSLPLTYQPISAELTALASLSAAPGYVKRLGAGSWGVSASIPISDVSGLQTALDGKLGANANAVSASKWATARSISATGDVSWSVTVDGSANATAAATVSRINGVSLAGLGTGLLKNTTASGVPSIAVAGTDYVAPSALANFVQGTNGSASTVVTGAAAISDWRRSGFYDFQTPTDSPNGSSNWTHVIHSQGASWASADRYAFDVAASFSGGSNTSWGSEVYAMRVVTEGTPQPWRKLWHDGNVPALATALTPSFLPKITDVLSGNFHSVNGGHPCMVGFGPGAHTDAPTSGTFGFTLLQGESVNGYPTQLAFDTQGGGMFHREFRLPSGGAPGWTAWARVWDTATLVGTRNEHDHAGTYVPLTGEVRVSGWVAFDGIIYSTASVNFSGYRLEPLGISIFTAMTIGAAGGPSLTLAAPTNLPDCWSARIGSGTGALTLASYLQFDPDSAFGGYYEVPSSTLDLPDPVEGRVIMISGQSLGPVSNNIRVPAGKTWLLNYRDDAGNVASKSAGQVLNVYGRAGLLLGGADGNWHLIHS